MSLKAFHVVFITISTLLSIGLGVWALRGEHTVLGVLAFGGAVALVGYGYWFLQKMKDVSYL